MSGRSLDRFMKTICDSSTQNIKRILHYLPSYSVCVDNYQDIRSKKYTTTGSSTSAIHGTIRYVRCHMLPITPAHSTIKHISTGRLYTAVYNGCENYNDSFSGMTQQVVIKIRNIKSKTYEITLPHYDYMIVKYSDRLMKVPDLKYINQDIRVPLYFPLLQSECCMFCNEFYTMHPNDNNSRHKSINVYMCNITLGYAMSRVIKMNTKKDPFEEDEGVEPDMISTEENDYINFGLSLEYFRTNPSALNKMYLPMI